MDAYFTRYCIVRIVWDSSSIVFSPLSRAMEEFAFSHPQHMNLKRPDDGHVPLHIACANNRFDVARLLLEMVHCMYCM